jgi:hypothetical protein
MNSFENKLEQNGKTKCPGGFFKNPLVFKNEQNGNLIRGGYTGRRPFGLLDVLFSKRSTMAAGH